MIGDDGRSAHVGPLGEDDPLEIRRPATVNGEAVAAAPPVAEGDPLDIMVADERMPSAMRVLAGRLRQAEQNMPAVLEATQRLIQLGANVDWLGKAVTQLSQQRALGELQMERQTRSAALDLAIKAARPEGTTAALDGGMITTLADAFLAWMKAGDA